MCLGRLKKLLMTRGQFRRYLGPFSVQRNNSTRAFEYPWAFEVGNLRPGMKVLEIGGGLSGFQFVVAQLGCSVVNVDPGLKATGVGWPCDNRSIAELNGCFRTQVDLRNTTVARAGLAQGEFDRAYSISVIEHLAPGEASDVMLHTYHCLKPGGLFVLTIDLFVNLDPFCARQYNEYGTNQNIRELISGQPWKLVVGTPDELFGFPEFDSEKVLSRLETFLLGQYPALVQCLALEKPMGC